MTLGGVPICPHEYVARNSMSLEDQQKVLDVMQRRPLSGYALFGPTGVGKSFLLWALAKEACYAGRRVIIRKCSVVLEAMKDSEDKKAEDRDHPDLIARADLDDSMGKTHFMIDEMDAIPTTAFAMRQLFDLIDYCYENSGKVVLSMTTNLGKGRFKDTFSPALYRRVESCCTQITMTSKVTK